MRNIIFKGKEIIFQNYKDNSTPPSWGAAARPTVDAIVNFS